MYVNMLYKKLDNTSSNVGGIFLLNVLKLAWWPRVVETCSSIDIL
jgi:hypothetical protein